MSEERIEGTSLLYLNWNDISELGLMSRINREILHPLGLAMSRDPDTGVSEMILISDDGEFGYPDGRGKDTLTDKEIRKKVYDMIVEKYPNQEQYAKNYYHKNTVGD